MRYSQLFGRTTKNIAADADSINAKLLTQAGFINKELAGVYSYLPLGLQVLTKIQNVVREEMNQLGAQEILLPVLSSCQKWQKTGRDKLTVLYRLDQLVLNPTHEEVVTPLVQQYVFSYRDLPLAVYQIQEKFRHEPRAKSGLLRNLEFNMKDLYSFHADEKDLDKFYNQVIETYRRIFNRLNLGEITFLTYASGGSFSKYSHEFQTICPTGEDLIYLCDQCQVAVNKELIEEQKTCPKCNSANLVEKKAIEVANIFKLGTKFSAAFGFNYTNEQGELRPVLMGCYGLGPSRLMGTLVEVFHDDRGIIWPEAVAPYPIHLVGLDPKAEEIYHKLGENNVLFDDRKEVTPGVKLTDADLIGLPWRWLVSSKSLQAGGIEIKRRNSNKIKIIPVDDAILKYGQAR